MSSSPEDRRRRRRVRRITRRVEWAGFLERRASAIWGLGLLVSVVAVILTWRWPGLVPREPLVGAAIAAGGLVVGGLLAAASDTTDRVVRGARHVKGSGAELVGVLPPEAAADAARDLAQAILDARPGDQALRVALSAARPGAFGVSPWAEALGTAVAQQGASVLVIDLVTGLTDRDGAAEVASGRRKLGDVARIAEGLRYARIGPGRDHDRAIHGLPALMSRLPRDLEVVIVAMPPMASREVIEATLALDTVLVVAERDRTTRLELLSALEAVGQVRDPAQVVLFDGKLARELGLVPGGLGEALAIGTSRFRRRDIDDDGYGDSWGSGADDDGDGGGSRPGGLGRFDDDDVGDDDGDDGEPGPFARLRAKATSRRSERGDASEPDMPRASVDEAGSGRSSQGPVSGRAAGLAGGAAAGAAGAAAGGLAAGGLAAGAAGGFGPATSGRAAAGADQLAGGIAGAAARTGSRPERSPSGRSELADSEADEGGRSPAPTGRMHPVTEDLRPISVESPSEPSSFERLDDAASHEHAGVAGDVVDESVRDVEGHGVEVESATPVVSPEPAETFDDETLLLRARQRLERKHGPGMFEDFDPLEDPPTPPAGEPSELAEQPEQGELSEPSADHSPETSVEAVSDESAVRGDELDARVDELAVPGDEPASRGAESALHPSTVPGFGDPPVVGGRPDLAPRSIAERLRNAQQAAAELDPRRESEEGDSTPAVDPDVAPSPSPSLDATRADANPATETPAGTTPADGTPATAPSAFSAPLSAPRPLTDSDPAGDPYADAAEADGYGEPLGARDVDVLLGAAAADAAMHADIDRGQPATNFDEATAEIPRVNPIPAQPVDTAQPLSSSSALPPPQSPPPPSFGSSPASKSDAAEQSVADGESDDPEDLLRTTAQLAVFMDDLDGRSM